MENKTIYWSRNQFFSGSDVLQRIQMQVQKMILKKKLDKQLIYGEGMGREKLMLISHHTMPHPLISDASFFYGTLYTVLCVQGT